ncbi:MAG: indole-3-glycerol phosphate synthase TrpC [Phycisphaerae bacterium]|nr:indole-3-glycerol phosphate synthase TrpC [Phycisphaerae bacterium]
MPPTILDTILETKREEVARLRDRIDEGRLRRQVADAPAPRNFYAAMTARSRGELNLIAEIKRASPSAGVIRERFDPVDLARRCEAGGANAISVLTDQTYFKGHLDYLAAVKGCVALPVLRKDFIIDPIQVYESRAAGADAILLIAAALPVGVLTDLMILAAELKMTSLVEVHDADELLTVRSMVGFPHRRRALLGINNRDLASFEVDIATTLRLAELAEPAAPIISESGIRTRDDVRTLRRAGVSGILVGETIMRCGDIAGGIEALVGPAR